uniref:BSD domain-containing protein n=1 Tax=Rhabditophanes sp. KR3021 TaxID=114890 RepID=A0AC35TSI4_9BILA
MTDLRLLETFNETRIRLPGASSKGDAGFFEVFTNRTRFVVEATNEEYESKYENIKGIRISPPGKSKVMMQLMLNDGGSITYIFNKSGASKDELLSTRDRAKEIVHHAMIRHRQAVVHDSIQAEQVKEIHENVKSKILDEDERLHSMYRLLVQEKFLSPADFWADHLEDNLMSKEESAGVSSGFLGAISQSEDKEGVTLNLSLDIINSIFKTYPAVERKHLETVPHDISEQDFWSKFFKSHYFHRDRDSANAPDAKEDIFFDCLKVDEGDMNNIIKQCLNSNVTKSIGNEDNFGVFSNEMDDTNGPRKNESKSKLLIRRCNYLSERIVKSIGENNKNLFDKPVISGIVEGDELSKVRLANKQILRVLKKEHNLPQLQSFMAKYNNLQETLFVPFGMTREEYGKEKEAEEEPMDYDDDTFDGYWDAVNANVSLELNDSFQDKLLNGLLHNNAGFDEVLEESKMMSDEEASDSEDDEIKAKRPRVTQGHQVPYQDRLSRNFDKLDEQMDKILTKFSKKKTKGREIFNDISENTISDVHEGCMELIRHFWGCFPPKCQEHVDKILKIVPALRDYDVYKLQEVSNLYGNSQIFHLRQMIATICERLEEMKTLFSGKTFKELELEGKIILDGDNSQQVYIFNGDPFGRIDEKTKNMSVAEKIYHSVMIQDNIVDDMIMDGLTNGYSKALNLVEHQEPNGDSDEDI